MSDQNKDAAVATVVIHHRDESRPCRRRFTLAGVLKKDGEISYGVAIANPLDKAFIKRKGTIKAIGRAISRHPFTNAFSIGLVGKTPSEIHTELHKNASFMAASLASMDEKTFVHEVGKTYGKPQTKQPRFTLETA